MTMKFMFGEHESCVEMLRHAMSAEKEAGGFVTVETERVTRHNFVLHTVCVEPAKKAVTVKFTKAKG